MKEIVEGVEWGFYALTAGGLLVLGFEDRNEAKDYCERNGLVFYTRRGLKDKKISPYKLTNWVDDNKVPEYHF